MRPGFRMSVVVVALAAVGAGAWAQSRPGEPDFESIVEDRNEVLKGEMDGMRAGDQKAFTVVTDDNIGALEVGDIYKSSGSFFKVTTIRSKGTDGGTFVVQRIGGEHDPSRKWNRVSGLGPLTIVSRETVLDRFLSGGWLMYPIAFLLLVTIIIALNSVWIYRRGKQCPGRFVEAARLAIGRGDMDEFGRLAMQERGLFATICRAMVAKFHVSTVADIQGRCEAEAMRQISFLRAPLKGLNFIASVAPLLGLLGTVFGMITCFDSLAEEAASAAKSQMMASGIKVALLTTAAGLSVAVPTLLVYFIFSQKLNLVIAYCETLASDFVHELAVVKRRMSAGRPAVEPDDGAEGRP